jgi:taurine dioxygenase
MAIATQSLDDPLGADVRGIDLSLPLAHGEVEVVEEAWRMRLVVVFRGQQLSDTQLLAFSRYFGELDPLGPNPYGEPYNKNFRRSTSSRTSSRTASRSAGSATAKPCGMPT